MERARERATLKHKNTGKWARAMKARGHLDEDQRRDINEMLEKGEQLRRKISGVASDEEAGEDESDEDAGDGSNALSRIKASAFNELERLDANDTQDDFDADGQPRKAKSVFEMKFMKDAATRQAFEVNKEMDDFRKEIGDLTDNDDERNVAQSDAGEAATFMSVERVGGRMMFQPGPRSQSQHQSSIMPPPPPSSISETSTLQSHDTRILSPVNEISASQQSGLSLSQSGSTALSLSIEEPNPWLQLGEGSSNKISRRKNEVVVGRDVSLAQKSEARMKAQLGKSTEGRARAADDATVELDETNALAVRRNATKEEDSLEFGKRRKKDKGNFSKANMNVLDDESGSDGEKEAQEEALLKGRKGLRAFEQKDLVTRAFAGDNVVRVLVHFLLHPLVSLTHFLRNSRSSSERRLRLMRLEKRISHYLDGFVGSLTSNSLFANFMRRVLGEGLEQRKHLRSRTSSRKLLASILSLELIITKHMSSSPRRGTKRRRSIRLRTFLTLTQARLSSSKAWTRL